MKNLVALLLLPGIKIDTSPTDLSPVQAVNLARLSCETSESLGNSLSKERA